MNLKEELQSLSEAARHITVLYVEDEEVIRQQTTILLRKIFSVIDTAQNGLEGLEHYRKGRYDLVISDLLMPGMNGFEMIRHIQAHTPQQSILILSACESNEQINALLAQDSIWMVAKPISIPLLVDVLREIVEVSVGRQGS